MNRKKVRPLDTESSEKTSAKFHQKWWLIALLAALLIGYLIWKSISPDTDTLPIKTSPSITAQTDVATSDSMPLDNMTNDTTSNESTPNESTTSSDTSNNQILDPNTVLNAPLPETDSLAKEEIDRLEDERQRLAEQEKLAAEQLAMNKQLTEMKAKQIALLEQQIAELEANNTQQNSVE